jgi:hypothetical protein
MQFGIQIFITSKNLPITFDGNLIHNGKEMT